MSVSKDWGSFGGQRGSGASWWGIWEIEIAAGPGRSGAAIFAVAVGRLSVAEMIVAQALILQELKRTPPAAFLAVRPGCDCAASAETGSLDAH